MGIRVLVADDDEVVRHGVASWLEHTDMALVGQAANAQAVLDMTVQHRPDVVLAEIFLDETDMLAALEQLRQQSPETRVVIFSKDDNPSHVARSVVMGACDYIHKCSSRANVLDAIRRAAVGQAGDCGLLQDVRSRLDGAKVRSRMAGLTGRETQVLRHVALGLSNREIAHSLQISVETVKEHVRRLLRKLNVRDRTQAAVWAVHHGLA